MISKSKTNKPFPSLSSVGPRVCQTNRGEAQTLALELVYDRKVEEFEEPVKEVLESSKYRLMFPLKKGRKRRMLIEMWTVIYLKHI